MKEKSNSEGDLRDHSSSPRDRTSSGGLLGFVTSLRKSFSGGDVRSPSSSEGSVNVKFDMSGGGPGTKRKTLVKTKSASGHVRPMTLLKETEEEGEE